jgi:hypothetical protein
MFLCRHYEVFCSDDHLVHSPNFQDIPITFQPNDFTDLVIEFNFSCHPVDTQLTDRLKQSPGERTKEGGMGGRNWG